MMYLFLILGLLLVIVGLVLLSMFKTAILAIVCVTVGLIMWLLENDYPRGGYE